MVNYEIKMIKPKKDTIDRKAIDKAAASIGKRIADNLRAQAKATVKTWEKQPQIKVKRKTTGDEIYVMLEIESWAKPIWTYLDKGTKPHTITPKNAPFLVFRQEGFTAKTKVNQFLSKAGSEASGELQFRLSVKHTGNEARNWSKMMLKRGNKKLDELVKKAKREMRN